MQRSSGSGSDNFNQSGPGPKILDPTGSTGGTVKILFDEQEEKEHTPSEAEQSVLISLSHMYMSQDS
jgi:hypothetical protein